jgi:hypothetical protein
MRRRRDASHYSWHSSARAPSARRCRFLPNCLLGLKSENVARLAREHLADRIERREANRPCLTGLEDRKVGERHSDPIRELSQSHPPIVKNVVELDSDRHIKLSLPDLLA